MSFLSIQTYAQTDHLLAKITQQMNAQTAQDFCYTQKNLASVVMLQRQAYGSFADLINKIPPSDDDNLEPLARDIVQLNREIIAKAYFTPIKQGSLFKQLTAKSFADSIYHSCSLLINTR